MRLFLPVILILLSITSCKPSLIHQDISSIEIDIHVKRFEIDFYNTTKETLAATKKRYPYLFPSSITDSIAMEKINNQDEQILFHESQKIFKDFASVEEELATLFKHIKYYRPRFKEPNIVTMITNIDYDRRIIYADSLLLISLDAYLGKDHRFYADFPSYISENNSKDHIVVDAANAIINTQISPLKERTFLGRMIYEGKRLHLLNTYLPQVPEKEKIGYKKEKLDWAIANEEQIWMFFIENDLLYNTDSKLIKRFIDNAPFSKFYLEEDKLSPGSIGKWIGWQIVDSYMKHNDVSLQNLFNTSAVEILNKSNYKPRK